LKKKKFKWQKEIDRKLRKMDTHEFMKALRDIYYYDAKTTGCCPADIVSEYEVEQAEAELELRLLGLRKMK